MIRQEQWRAYFHDFPFPYTFYSDDEYKELIKAAGLVVKRIELVPKTMVHKGQEGFSGMDQDDLASLPSETAGGSPGAIRKRTRRYL
jgi:hypothetical protein